MKCDVCGSHWFSSEVSEPSIEISIDELRNLLVDTISEVLKGKGVSVAINESIAGLPWIAHQVS